MRHGIGAARRAGIAATFVALVSVVAGCSDALYTGAAHDTPLFSFSPYFNEPHEEAAFEGKSVGIVWVDPLQLRDDLPHRADSYQVTRSERSFTVGLFSPPPEAAMRRIPDPMTNEIAVSFAFAEIVLYDDGDDDGRFRLAPRAEGSAMVRPDAYRGSTEDRVLIYVEQPAKVGGPVGVSWFTLFEEPGYRLASIDCDLSVFNPPVQTILGDRSFPMLFAANPSPTMVVTRKCLSSVPRTLQ